MNRRAFAVIAVLVALGWPVWALAATPDVTEPKNLDTFTLWSIVSGFVAVWIAALVNRVHWPDYIRFGVFFVWCIVGAAITAAVKGDLDGHDFARSLLIVAASGMLTYSATRGAVKSFEAATS